MRPSAPVAKAAVTGYIAALSARDFNALPSFFSSNATWWVSGNPARVPQAGLKPVAEQLPSLPKLLTKFDEYSYDITNLVGEGNRVMVEAQAVGKGPGELVYVNNISSSYVVNSEGLIDSLREYPVQSEIDWLLEWFQKHPNAASS